MPRIVDAQPKIDYEVLLEAEEFAPFENAVYADLKEENAVREERLRAAREQFSHNLLSSPEWLANIGHLVLHLKFSSMKLRSVKRVKSQPSFNLSQGERSCITAAHHFMKAYEEKNLSFKSPIAALKWLAPGLVGVVPQIGAESFALTESDVAQLIESLSVYLQHADNLDSAVELINTR